MTGARLIESGMQRVRIIEKGGDFGGTWYWNRYPGAACDVESYVYLPLCEELNFVPKEKYTHAPEILAHSRACGEKFNLYEYAAFRQKWKACNGMKTANVGRYSPIAVIKCVRSMCAWPTVR
ncbi:MAG: hypothetical protein CM15mP120_28870 [Pseudomonadota bacterium]|nr:MAG: hypothetical protein CM15mP120_28870 [Pseudomonadota bacterium]